MKNFKAVSLFGSVIVAGGLLIGCSSGEVTKVESNSSENAAAENDNAKEEKPAEEKKETDDLKVGESVELNGLKFTLNEIKNFEPTEYDYNEKGTFVVIDFAVSNSTEEEADPSNLMFSLKDKDGNTYSSAYSSAEESQWADAAMVKLPAGDKLKAQTSFDVPKDVNEYKLIVQDLFDGGQAIYNVTVE